jgi:hypothetical protein
MTGEAEVPGEPPRAEELIPCDFIKEVVERTRDDVSALRRGSLSAWPVNFSGESVRGPIFRVPGATFSNQQTSELTTFV